MEILIICNYFIHQNRFLPKILKRFLDNYNLLKLKSLIKKLKKTYGNSLNINVIIADSKIVKLNKKVKVEYLSDLRLEINHLEFLKLKENVAKSTRLILIKLFNNLIRKKICSYEGIFIPKLFEFKLSLFLDEIIGNYEVLRQFLQKKDYKKIVLFNCNSYTYDFFKELNTKLKNIELHKDSLVLKKNKVLNLISISKYFLTIIGVYFKRILAKKTYFSSPRSKNHKKNIIFFANSENQYISIKPVYDYLKNDKEINPIHYKSETYITLRNMTSLIRFLNHIHQSLRRYNKTVSEPIKYKQVNLVNVLKGFYYNESPIDLIKLFIVYANLKVFIKKNPPELFVITNDFLASMRLAAKYLQLEKIPTLYIPHAAIPIIDELATKNDIKYFALGGHFDKEYYIQKGVKDENIEITGVPRYEYYYKNQYKELSEVLDMFDGRKYSFEQNKFTILLTTNPIADESNEKIITAVVNSLKELNLEKSLIIKLHPRENGVIHKKICAKLGINPIIVKDLRILDVIRSSNLLISQKSTTILESMLVGTPVICLDFVNKNFRETSKYLFLDEKYINIVYDQDTLTQQIKELITNKSKISNYIQKLNEEAKKFVFYDINNPPIKKIAELILHLLK